MEGQKKGEPMEVEESRGAKADGLITEGQASRPLTTNGLQPPSKKDQPKTCSQKILQNKHNQTDQR